MRGNFGIAYDQRWLWQRKDHSTIIYPLLELLVIRDSRKLFGRVLGKYASTYAKVAAFDSIIKFNSQSKVDKLSVQDKKKPTLQLTNKVAAQLAYCAQRTHKNRIYTQLYNQNIYLLANEKLKDKSCKLIITGKDILLLKDLFGCSLLYPFKLFLEG
jgi:hypothetical protein